MAFNLFKKKSKPGKDDKSSKSNRFKSSKKSIDTKPSKKIMSKYGMEE